MILDSFLRMIQIWKRNSASHLSMENGGGGRKQESRIDGFVSLSKMSFLRPNKVKLSFSQTLNPEDFSLSQKGRIFSKQKESFLSNMKNFETERISSLK